MAKKKPTKFQRKFSEGFTGRKSDKATGIAPIHGQDQSRAAKEKRRKSREKKRK